MKYEEAQYQEVKKTIFKNEAEVSRLLALLNISIFELEALFQDESRFSPEVWQLLKREEKRFGLNQQEKELTSSKKEKPLSASCIQNHWISVR